MRGDEPMPDGPERQSSAPRVDWDRLRPGTDARKSFEDLCCFLAEREPAPDGSKFKRLAPPDGGVECLRRLPGGQEWGWQAKYFHTAPNSGQWRQIDESVRSALKSNPRLTRYIVCAPSDRTKAGAAKWNRLVEQWNAIKPIAYEYWGRHELESRLIDDKNHDLLKYYFDKEFLSADWAERTVATAIADAGPRYTPEQNINLPIAKRFQALCGAEAFFSRLDDVAASMRDRLSAASTRPALDAAGDDFAKLGNAIEYIAALLTGHAAHRKGGVPAAQIKEKSHEAKAIISGIASRLANDGRKSGSKEAGQHSEGSAFDMEMHRLRWLYEDLDELTDGQLSEDMDVHKTRALLVVGDAGVGKTHLFCGIARGRTDRRQMTVLLHGSHFYDGPPKEAIIKSLDLDCRFSELLEGLNLAGQLADSRSLLMIDALNEEAGKNTWKRHIRGLLREVSKFPHIALALSVRTPYEPEVIPDDIVETALRRIIHPGFGGRTEAALAMFFDNKGIERPAVPLMAPEFSNPQFLTVLCRALKNKGHTRMPDDINGIVLVYNLLIDSVNDKLAGGDELAIPREFKIVHRAVDAIAGCLIGGDGESLEYAEAYRLLSGLDPALKNLDRLLGALISEGILGAYSPGPHAGTDARRVRFAYERMSDNLVIKSLLDAAATAGEAAAMLKKGGSLAAYTANPSRHRGLVDALSVQLPERFQMELLEAAPSAPRKQLTESFLDSLLWRSPRSIGRTAVRIVDELLTGRRFPDRVLRALLTHSTNPDSPLNADYLHRHLLGLGMADRDSYLAIFLHTEHIRAQYNVVDNFTSWARSEGRKFDDKTIRLAGMALGWFLTASNRIVRDLSTKALVSMFSGCEDLLVGVMSEFKGCNDPYVPERLFCAAYGCAMGGRSDEGLKRLADYAYDTVFRQGSPPPDIMLRDYALGIIQLAGHRGIRLDFDPESCIPPHNAEWISDLPTEQDIKDLEKKHAGVEQSRGGAVHIFASLGHMGDFYRYIIGEGLHGPPWINVRLPANKVPWLEALGAFEGSITPKQKGLGDLLKLIQKVRTGTGIAAAVARQAGDSGAPDYVDLLDQSADDLGPHLSPAQAATFTASVLPYLKYALSHSHNRYRLDQTAFARWIARRVFELGWSRDKFDGYDEMLRSGDDRPGGSEGIGKKYQWIAYHELLARLCDNFEFRGLDYGRASVYESTSQLLSTRDIDPSMPHVSGPADMSSPGPFGQITQSIGYNSWDVIPNNAAWLKLGTDLPSFDRILEATDDGGSKWLVLDMFWAADQPSSRRGLWPTTPYKHVELWAKSCIVSKSDAQRLRMYAGDHNSKLLRFPDPEESYGLFLGELYWRGAYADTDSVERPETAISMNETSELEAYWTTHKYYAERSDRDYSLKNSMMLMLPSNFLAARMGLSNMNDGTFNDVGGTCAARCVAIGDRGLALLVRQDSLTEFLKSSDCELFWHAASYKYVIRGVDQGNTSEPNRLAAYSLYHMSNDGPKLVRRDAECDNE